jgi:peptidoglycan hydrolase-like protein with peptidoglycan-binding domain
MALHSRLFARVPELEACLVQDSAHLRPGVTGDHVRLVQTALVYLGFRTISGREYIAGSYGPTTAAAVLEYKTKRKIINFSYQTKPDNIVGKMTIKRLDQEMFIFQNLPAPTKV